MEARTKKSNTRNLRIRKREMECFLKLTGHLSLGKTRLFHDFVAEFLDHGVRQDLPGHPLNLLFGGIASHAV